jgi:hypothetical protein
VNFRHYGDSPGFGNARFAWRPTTIATAGRIMRVSGMETLRLTGAGRLG